MKTLSYPGIIVLWPVRPAAGFGGIADLRLRAAVLRRTFRPVADADRWRACCIARILDAFIDPAIGLWIDRRRAIGGYRRFILLSLPLLVCGFIALFHPPQDSVIQPFVWFLLSLMVVYLGFSLATIAYQSWGATLTQERAQRSRLTAVREACGLAGVIIAAALPGIADLGWLSLVFIASLLATAILLLRHAPRPEYAQPGQTQSHRIRSLRFAIHASAGCFRVHGERHRRGDTRDTVPVLRQRQAGACRNMPGCSWCCTSSREHVSMPLWVALGEAAWRTARMAGLHVPVDRHLRLGLYADPGRGDRLMP